MNNANEIIEQKKKKIIQECHRPNYLDTKTMMEKLGIKVSNEELCCNNKRNSVKIKKLKETNNIITSDLKEENNINNNNKNSKKSNSQKKEI